MRLPQEICALYHAACERYVCISLSRPAGVCGCKSISWTETVQYARVLNDTHLSSHCHMHASSMNFCVQRHIMHIWGPVLSRSHTCRALFSLSPSHFFTILPRIHLTRVAIIASTRSQIIHLDFCDILRNMQTCTHTPLHPVICQTAA